MIGGEASWDAAQLIVIVPVLGLDPVGLPGAVGAVGVDVDVGEGEQTVGGPVVAGGLRADEGLGAPDRGPVGEVHRVEVAVDASEVELAVGERHPADRAPVDGGARVPTVNRNDPTIWLSGVKYR